jgi:MFS transporter, OCT family, solute carrier family 22 (organic cation transporter), member 4/5
LASFSLLIIGGLGVTFGPQKSFGTLISYIIYAISRFVIAIGTRGINLTAYVLGMELLESRKKTFGGMIFQLAFPIGQLILALIAYFIRDWRTLALVCCIPSIPFLLYYL